TTYLATLDREEMTREDTNRLDDILAFASNIGHAADVTHQGLLNHISTLRKQGWILPQEQRQTLDESLARLLSNQRETAALFINGDLPQARELAGEKACFREMVQREAESHLNKIKSGQIDAVETGAL